MPDPWDQLMGEPKESFCRFLFYRNLGPTRSLAKAYRAYLNTLPDAEAKQQAHTLTGVKKCSNRAPGNWYQDSIRHKWDSRSNSWDINQLQNVASDIAPMWAAILRTMVMKTAEALARPGFKPKSWRDAVLIFNQVAPYLNPDVFKALVQSSGTTPGVSEGKSSTGDPGTTAR
jgi:hypothetical protein